MTSTSTADVAVTVAVRGLSVSRAISPNQSPEPRSAIFLPFFDTRAVACDEHEELAAGAPLARQHRSLAQVDLVGDPGELAQLGLRASREERNLLQQLHLRVTAQRHARIICSGPGRIEDRGASRFSNWDYPMTCEMSRLPRPCVWAYLVR